MAENDVTKEQLEQGNEPAFGPTLEARTEAEQHEATVEEKYRASESEVRDQTQGRAQRAIGKGLGEMHGARAAQIAKVVGEQVGTMGKDAAERLRITNSINSIKNKTKADVTSISERDGIRGDATVRGRSEARRRRVRGRLRGGKRWRRHLAHDLGRRLG